MERDRRDQREYRDYYPEEFEEQEIHLRDYLQIVSKRKYLILTVLAVVFLVVALKTFTTTPIYTASSQVLIERNYGSKGLENQFSRWEPDFLETQSQIIQSTNVAQKVVEQLNLTTRYRSYFFEEETEVTFVQSVKQSIKAVIGPAYDWLRNLAGGSEEVEAGVAGESFNDEPMTEEEIIASIIQGGLSVTPVKNTKIVTISFSHENPGIAKIVSDAVVKAYMDEMLEIRLSTSSYSVKWMTDKAREEREKLEHSERLLQQFMRDNDLVTVEDKLTVLPQKLSGFGNQISKAEAEKKELADQLAQIRAAGNNLDRLEKIPALASSEVLKSIRERIYKANLDIQELSKKYGHKHPKMIQAQSELRSLTDEKSFEIERVLSSITNSYELAASKEESLKELLADTKSQMLESNEKFMQYKVMKREVDSNRAMYDTLQAGIKKESVTEQSQSVNIWVTKKAEMPLSPSQPNTKRNLLLGLILGLFGGVGLAFFIEYLDNTVKDEKDLGDRFGGSILGSVEELKKNADSIESVVVTKPLSPVAESYRLIRSSLLLSAAGKPPETILVTSMGMGEGKTTTTANLARILAQNDKKVLVIDCDLRKPRLGSFFGVRNEVGLSSILTGSGGSEAIVQPPNEGISAILSGPIPPAPAELLGSDRMKMLIESMKQEYDFILLDSPPVQSVTDSLALCQLVDGVVVVVRAGKTTNEMLESGLKKLSDVNGKVLGFVLNGMKMRGNGYYSYGYGSYYTRNEGEE
ncbi:GumC family protein [Desulfosediminicola ganghwensis]|uniref:GumC family protein n=1 Tax=Desulfosediminicola ganghwensis TaxID=2569540 RepID=UPI0010AD8C7B|nr:polysaccharide biosynthesis tyrosine autokinase [Desulfosediminicola ganghwensis]